MMIRLLSILLLTGLPACIHPKVNLQKAGLLNPLMDPAKSGMAQSLFQSEPVVWHELGAGEIGSSLGSSCPTCGG